MKACIVKNHFFLLHRIAGLVVALAAAARAQTYTTLIDLPYDYGSPGLILSRNTLYVSNPGNPLGYFGHVGLLFKINTDGSGVVPLHQFGGSGDGSFPEAGLVLVSNVLYGTASQGGSTGSGTVVAINTDGTGYGTIYNFTQTAYSSPPYVSALTNSDGAAPYCTLVASGNWLYGTARLGGGSANGTVFKVSTDGTVFRTLYTFSGPGFADPSAGVTNSDGAHPVAGLVLSGNTLYGTTRRGGTAGNGTVFAVNTDGTGFTNLHSFTTLDPVRGTNSDGAAPASPFLLSGTTLYGTTPVGGSASNGTVFKLSIDGTGFKVLHGFVSATDGAAPQAGLVLWGNTLYGTANSGGTWGFGTVFALSTEGQGFQVLKSFTGQQGDGANPTSALILSGNAVYGGLNNSETGNGASAIFKLSYPAPELTIIPSPPNVILTWPTDYRGFPYTGFILQSTANLVSPLWTTNSVTPIVVNGQNMVTNPLSGTQQFYRLTQ